MIDKIKVGDTVHDIKDSSISDDVRNISGEDIDKWNSPSGGIYSTDEVVVGTWIDGKPLYRKVVTGTVPTVSNASTTKDNSVFIANNVDFAMVEAASMWTVDNNWADMPSSIGNTHVVLYVVDNALNITNRGFAYYSGCTVYAAIKYTKTTD